MISHESPSSKARRVGERKSGREEVQMLLICAVPECKADCEQDGSGWNPNSVLLGRTDVLFSRDTVFLAKALIDFAGVLSDSHIWG